MRDSQLVAAALAASIVITPLAITTVASAAPAAAPTFGTTWTVDTALNLLTEYAPGASGAATPVASIHGAATGLVHPTGVAVSPSGKLYVSDAGDDAITEYAAGTTGNVAPLSTIKGSRTGLSAPASITLDGPDLWVADPTDNAVEAFTTGSNGNVLPAKSISGHKTGLDNPVSLAINPAAEADNANAKDFDDPFLEVPALWVINKPQTDPATVMGFDTENLGDSAPTITVHSTAKHPLVSPAALLDDGFGDVLVADSGRNSVTRIIDEPTITMTPPYTPTFKIRVTTQLAGSHTGLSAPGGLSVNALNQLVVVNSGDGGVSTFREGASGNIAPLRSVSDVPTPSAATVPGVAPSRPTGLTATLHSLPSKRGSSASLSWTPPASTGGGIIGYDVMTEPISLRQSGNGPGGIAVYFDSGGGPANRIYTSTRNTTFLKLHLRHDRRYRFSVIAVNAFGSSKASASASVTLPGSPGAPPYVDVTNFGPHGALAVRWASASGDGGAPIRHYDVEYATCTPGHKGCTFQTKETAATARQVTLRHLADRTTYHVRVVATNRLGLGLPSRPVTCRTF